MTIKASSLDVKVDTNKDRLVSLSEFMAATKKEEFFEKDEWEVRVGWCSLVSLSMLHPILA